MRATHAPQTDARRYYTVMPSPVGDLLVVGDGEAVTGVHFGARVAPRPGWRVDPAPVAEAVDQLSAYFAGARREFDLWLAPAGTSFQRRVWAALAGIPYGETTSYGKLAAEIGRPGSARAVGAANGANPLAIVIPCHRVIGADGTLTGYAGGLAAKRHLLALEGALPG
jgi:methylated-DNA-[protein]-cysteine S-methyltransferase